MTITVSFSMRHNKTLRLRRLLPLAGVIGWCDGKLPVSGVLLIWIMVRQEPTALAVDAAGGCLDIFLCFSPSLWETAILSQRAVKPKTTKPPLVRIPKIQITLQTSTNNVSTIDSLGPIRVKRRGAEVVILLPSETEQAELSLFYSHMLIIAPGTNQLQNISSAQ